MSSQSPACPARQSTTSRTSISVSGSAPARATSTHSSCFRLEVLPALPRHPRRRPHLFRSPRPRRRWLRALPLRRLRPLPLHIPPSPLPHRSPRLPRPRPVRSPHHARRLAVCRSARLSRSRRRANTESRARRAKLANHRPSVSLSSDRQTVRAAAAQWSRRRLPSRPGRGTRGAPWSQEETFGQGRRQPLIRCGQSASLIHT
jgi:hypothetical protein